MSESSAAEHNHLFAKKYAYLSTHTYSFAISMAFGVIKSILNETTKQDITVMLIGQS